ncbi:MAG: hypothetical protein H0W02_11930 [Ktedonobacteraceae bacterium]|nr:hypothetical protein [Ktedonobacteraceae bacterium]
MGALILEPTQQYFLLQYGENGYYLIVYGTLFLVIILLLPQGIVPSISRLWIKYRSVPGQPVKTTKIADVPGQEQAVFVEKGDT